MPAPDLTIWKSAKRMSPSVVGFLPLKTPIDCEGVVVDEEDEFTVSMFMERQATDGRSVGLCIDLTSPWLSGEKLYDTDEWTRDWDVQYVSIPCAPPLPEAAASAERAAVAWVEPVPSEDAVRKFVTTVDEFWAQPSNKRLHIAVHCVTGVNLTGYMMGRYGISHSVPLPKVLGAFAASRQPGVYSPELLEALWEVAATSGHAANGWVQPQPPTWHALARREIVIPPPVPLPAQTSSGEPAAAQAPPQPPVRAKPPARAKPAVPLFNAPDAPGTKRNLPPPLAPPSAAATGADSAASQPHGAAPATKSQRTDAQQTPPPEGGYRGATSRSTGATEVVTDVLSAVGTRLTASEASELHARCEALVKGEAAAADAAAVCWHTCEPLRRSHLQRWAGNGGAGRLVSWKAAGERCLLLVLRDAPGDTSTRSVVLDRGAGAWQLPAMHWPRPAAAGKGEGNEGGEGDGAGGVHGALVLAGELVCDREGASAPPVWRLLCDDLLALGGHSVTSLPLQKRLALMGSEVIAPRRASASVATERLRVRAKDCFRLKYVPYLLGKFMPKLTHASVGLIFFDAEAPCTAGRSDRAVEWRKPTREETSEGEHVPESELVALAEQHFK